MQAERWEHFKTVFQSALECAPSDRERFVTEACGRDLSLKADVLRLLSDYARADNFLETQSGAIPAGHFLPGLFGTYHAGDLVANRFRLVRFIARGGMGEVWLADQMTPIRRQVAIKLIKAGMDTHEVVARFERERQALALMDHPAIARMFEAGATEHGRPYFAMEYIAGLPITDYCDQNKLPIAQRLKLFVRVCEAIQYAHQKAVIHRDLKPSNILVSEVDGQPFPRVIDFGIAKATSPLPGTERSATQVGVLVGTPAFMSPEQATSGGVDIDTRSDVYSLGVVLYVLLTGCPPLDLEKFNVEDAIRRLQQDDAPRPSTRFRASGEESIFAARNRGADRARLVRQLRGDLDAIALKALAKERSWRYSSPSELADDIGRFLRHEPVFAHPPRAGYRARKYLRRHRLGATISAVAALLLVAFATAQSIELRRIQRERDRADRITNFMKDMFKVSDPSAAKGTTITAREILDKASSTIDKGLSKDPEEQAQMMDVMQDVYDDLGLYAQAQSLLTREVDIRRRVLGPNNRDTLASNSTLGTILMKQGKYTQAELLMREALEIQQRVLGPEHPDTLWTMNGLALVLWRQNRLAEAEQLDRKILEIRRRLLSAPDVATLTTMNNLANLLDDEGRYSESEKLHRETLDGRRRTFGEENLNTLQSMNNLANVLMDERHLQEAEGLLRETLRIRRRIAGPEHPDTLDAMNNLGNVLIQEDRFPEAEKLYRQTLEVRSRVLGPEHPETLQSMNNEAVALKAEGHLAEAEQLQLTTLAIKRRVFGKDHPEVGMSLYNLASIASLEGKRDQAFQWAREAVDHGLESDAVMGIGTDPDLKPLHGDPRFDQLVVYAKKHAQSPTTPK
jgi:eukaryotic-like serine/threonine-protein kinase